MTGIPEPDQWMLAVAAAHEHLTQPAGGTKTWPWHLIPGGPTVGDMVHYLARAGEPCRDAQVLTVEDGWVVCLSFVGEHMHLVGTGDLEHPGWHFRELHAA